MLIFTSSQCYFVCSVESCSEDTHHQPPRDPYYHVSQINENRHNLTSWEMPSPSSTSTPWSIYNRIIRDYIKRDLTYPSDTLNATSGVLKSLGRYTDDAFLCGLPAKLFPYGLLWQPEGPSERKLPWPSWSWAGWTGPIVTPAYLGIEKEYGGIYRRTMVTALQELRLCGEDGTTRPIDQPPSDGGPMRWMTTGLTKQTKGVGHLKAPLLSPDRDFVECGRLHFRSRSVLLSISPDRAGFVESSSLLQCRLLKDDYWIGNMFLAPGYAKDHASKFTGEFVHLTSFSASFSEIDTHYLHQLPVSRGSRDMPQIFDKSFYKTARETYRKKREKKLECGRMGHPHDGYSSEHYVPPPYVSPQPPMVQMKHVMWIQRETGNTACRRAAIGLIADFDLVWQEGSFCLE